jgi:hypothetical protein
MFAKGWIVSLIAGLVMAGLVGCGGSASTPAANATADAGNASTAPLPLLERLPGDWAGVMVVDEEGVKQLEPEKIQALREMEMGITFLPDGKMILSGFNNGKPYESEGAWQLVKEEGEQLTLRSYEADGKQKDIVLMFHGNDRFVMPLKTEVANLGAMQFERMR